MLMLLIIHDSEKYLSDLTQGTVLLSSILPMSCRKTDLVFLGNLLYFKKGSVCLDFDEE